MYNARMTLKVVVHAEESGGYWAEVPSLPGCGSQGESIPELMARIREPIEGWLSVGMENSPSSGQVYEIAV